jgi:hypothetical protein
VTPPDQLTNTTSGQPGGPAVNIKLDARRREHAQDHARNLTRMAVVLIEKRRETPPRSTARRSRAT